MNIQAIKSLYTYLESQQTAQQFLHHCYQKLPDVDADVKSYENCTTFMYYLRHGKLFYESGQVQHIALKPILLFYGMAHLLKACLITKRPDYPESTTILAHGVSTRKRKKRDYNFLQDEVKLQHNGLFRYFSEHLFQVTTFPFEKIQMESLLKLIPELTTLFHFHQDESMVHVGKMGDDTLRFPTSLLDQYHLTEKAFIQRIKPYLGVMINQTSDKKSMILQLKQPLRDFKGPFFFNLHEQIYFPANRDHFIPLHEVMIHYLLLYNLSMLSRYEAEWWGDLIVTKSDSDYPFIEQFLETTAKKIPILLGRELFLMLD
ncbi:YaaC family protein [Virgibacillus soli]|uniref:YaaC family protein n=1 Tax=Paracerasibacillus soli TaxID=480284 RepID=UPI0035F02AF0